MKIVTLLENNSISDAYIGKHGLSLYIEKEDCKILFDVGPDDSFIINALESGINLTEVEYLIISHGHRDHCGGLGEFLKHNDHAKIFMHRKTLEGHFARQPSGEYRNIGIGEFEVSPDRLILLEADFSVMPGVSLIMNYDKAGFLPKWNSVLFKKEADRDLEIDEFQHEVSLLVRDGTQNIFITGCSHSGIGNMIRTVRSRETIGEIDYVVGGFHLYSPSEKKLEDKSTIDALVSELSDYPSTCFYTGHCTGSEGYRYLKEQMEQQVREIHSGLVIDI